MACERGHQWILQNMGNKTWVVCHGCSKRFQFTQEFNGAAYNGPVPEKYKVL